MKKTRILLFLLALAAGVALADRTIIVRSARARVTSVFLSKTFLSDAGVSVAYRVCGQGGLDDGGFTDETCYPGTFAGPAAANFMDGAPLTTWLNREGL